jgi:hypothetical protein
MRKFLFIIGIFLSSIGFSQTMMVVDSGLTVIPIIENEDIKGSRYIKDIKLVYDTPPFCGNSTRAVFLLYTGQIVKPITKFVCKSHNGYISFTAEESKVLASSQVVAIRIENLDTGVFSNHVLADRDFFIKIYKLVDKL